MRYRFGNRKLRCLNFDHHLTHAAYACYGSPFSEAACMIVDGTGEQGSISCYAYGNGRLHPLSRHRGPESLGGLYMLITELCGFSSFGGEEWKVMGLAPYGRTDEEIYRVLRPMISCAVQRHGLSAGANPARQRSLQPVAIGAVAEVTKRLKLFSLSVIINLGDRPWCFNILRKKRFAACLSLRF
ncbi:MAG: carbamoyltransferase N-terminal domain-containing protein [Gammaproteobacteria bacterium]